MTRDQKKSFGICSELARLQSSTLYVLQLESAVSNFRAKVVFPIDAGMMKSSLWDWGPSAGIDSNMEPQPSLPDGPIDTSGRVVKTTPGYVFSAREKHIMPVFVAANSLAHLNPASWRLACT